MEKNAGLSEVVRGSFWLISGSIIVNLGALVFWIISGKIAGAEAVGYATTAFSISIMLASLGNLGLDYAVLREVPVKGAKAYFSSLILALALGLTVSLLAILFGGVYGGFTQYIPLIICLTVISIITYVSVFALTASLNPKYVFITNIASTMIKLSTVLAFILLGLGGYGIILAILMSQIVGFTLSTFLAVRILGLARPYMEDIKEVLRIGISNYPQMLSTQLIVSAGIVLIALLTSIPENTGTFYIALMIVMALITIPNAMATMSLPVMVKTKNHNLASESLRLGGGFVLPIAVAIAVTSKEFLSLINPEFQSGYMVLTLLTFSIIPYAAILTAISKLNSQKKLWEILLIGIVRLATLILLIIVLTPYFGIFGAALAYLASTLTPIPLVKNVIPLYNLAKLLMVQIPLTFINMYYVLPLVGPVMSFLISIFLTLLALRLMKIFYINEIYLLVKIILGGLK